MTSNPFSAAGACLTAALALFLLAGCEEDDKKKKTVEAPTFLAAYVANEGAGTVSGYLLDSESGALNEMDGSPFVAQPGSRMMAIDPAGTMLFTANSTHGSVSLMAVAAGTGALSRQDTIGASSGPRSVAVTPDGGFLYVATDPGSLYGVAGFEINASAQSLIELAGSPFDGVDQHESVAIEAAGGYLYVNCPGYDSKCDYEIDAATGALTSLGMSGFDGLPTTLVTHPAERFICGLADGGPSVRCWDIATDGSTTQTGQVFPTGISPRHAVFHPSEDFLYFTSDNGLEAVSFNAAGALSGLGAPFPYTDTPDPTGTAIDPTGQFLLVTDSSSDAVLVYEIDPASGALTLLDSYGTGASPVGVLSAALQ